MPKMPSNQAVTKTHSKHFLQRIPHITRGCKPLPRQISPRDVHGGYRQLRQHLRTRLHRAFPRRPLCSAAQCYACCRRGCVFSPPGEHFYPKREIRFLFSVFIAYKQSCPTLPFSKPKLSAKDPFRYQKFFGSRRPARFLRISEPSVFLQLDNTDNRLLRETPLLFQN